MTARPEDPHIGIVVEGPGDAAAVPTLLRNWLTTKSEFRDILGRPVSCNGRDKALRPKGIEGFVAAAGARPGCRGVLVVLDSEKDLACRLGPKILHRAKTVTRLPVSICLAEARFEDWIIASAETLDLGLTYAPGTSGLTLIKRSLEPEKYVKPTWQPRLTARMDIALAITRNPSLSRTLGQAERLITLVSD